jgi:hypothetical protein
VIVSCTLPFALDDGKFIVPLNPPSGGSGALVGAEVTATDCVSGVAVATGVAVGEVVGGAVAFGAVVGDGGSELPPPPQAAKANDTIRSAMTA